MRHSLFPTASRNARFTNGDFGRMQSLNRLYVKHHNTRSWYSPTTAFIWCSALLIPLTAAVVWLSVSSSSPFVTGHDIKYSYSGSGSKRDFLSGLSAESYRDAAGKILFIAQVIGGKDTDKNLQLARMIVNESIGSGYDPILATAVILAESTFNHRARSSAGALGLMQLLPDTAQYISKKEGVDWLGKNKLLDDPAYNIKLGIAYLQYLENYFGRDIKRVLIAYNWGPGNMLQALKNQSSPPRISVTYADKILSRYRVWTREYDAKRAALKFVDTRVIEG